MPRSAYETAAGETPAASATSRIVTRLVGLTVQRVLRQTRQSRTLQGFHGPRRYTANTLDKPFLNRFTEAVHEPLQQGPFAPACLKPVPAWCSPQPRVSRASGL